MRNKSLAFLTLAVVVFPTICAAQAIYVSEDAARSVRLPRPNVRSADGYHIKELLVQSKIKGQVAQVQVSQTFVNTSKRTLMGSFMFPIPYDGAISQLTLMINGKEHPGTLLDARKARALFESIVRRNQDPALLEWVGSGVYRTSVFPIPPGAERRVTLSYSQICRKQHGLTDFMFPLGTAKYTSKPVEHVRVEVFVESEDTIKNIYSPSHAIAIKRPNPRQAKVIWDSKNEVPTGNFRLFYDVGRGKIGTSVLSYRPVKGEDGYFLLLASPQIEAKDAKRPSKAVVIMIDRSGSMKGKKIEDAKKSVRFVINHLRKGDRFNIVAYDSKIESFKDGMQPFDEESRKAALGFVEGIYAGGATNIDGALQTGLKMVEDEKLPSYVLFLTDGQPTVGETNESKIVVRTKKANERRARILSLGLGYDVNSRLLDRLSRANHGQSLYIRENENLETVVANLYEKINSPVMTDVTIAFEFDGLDAEDGKPINRVYPKRVYDLFEGEQLVMAGRYRKAGRVKVTITGMVDGNKQTLTFPVDLTDKSMDQSNIFVEKLWASRRIGEIIDQLDLVGKNEELIKELVALSTKHGIITPYTSFIADENTRLSDNGVGKENIAVARKAVEQLDEAEGQVAFAQRQEKGKFLNASRPAAATNYDPKKQAKWRDVEDDKLVATKNVRRVANHSLYCRGKVWVTPKTESLDLKKDAKIITTIVRFTPAYFDLMKRNNKSQNALLANQGAAEELLVNWHGKNWHIK
jgi:Ca-activated chloride channel family protein